MTRYTFTRPPAEGDPPTTRVRSQVDFKQCPYCKSTTPLKDGEYKCNHYGYSESVK